MKKTALFFVFSILIISCGPSAQQKQKLEEDKVAHDDSIKRAAEDETKRKFAEKESLENSIRKVTNDIETLQSNLRILNSNLEVQKDQMNHIKEWQLGRSQSERDQQIGNQSMAIQTTQNNIGTTEENLRQLQTELSSLKADHLRFE